MAPPETSCAGADRVLAKLQGVLRQAPILLLAVDASGTFSIVEGGAVRDWQGDSRPHMGQSMFDLVYELPDLVDGFEKALRGQSQRCRSYLGERIFELAFSPAAVSDDGSVRAYCIAEDITERAESEKQRIEEQIASFEQQRRTAADFRAVIERLPLGIVVTRNRRVMLCNRSAADCLGWRESDTYVGSDFWEVFTPDKRALLTNDMDKSLEPIRVGEVQLGTGDGKSILADVQVVGIDFEGAPANLFAIRDVTEVHRMEQDLRQAHRLEAIGRLAAGIAHEINTPIQFIGDNAAFLVQAFADVASYVVSCEEGLKECRAETAATIASRKEELDVAFVAEEAPRATASILEGVRRVANIVSAMKAHAHPGSAEKSLSDLNRALENTVLVATNEWKYVATVVTDLGELPLVPCRLGEMNQVFLNLLVNAAHAIAARRSKEDEKGLISVRTFVENDMAVVAITDDGTGIPPEIREHIFDPFFTTKEVGKGTGQGLTLARRVVVDQHGGKLELTSNVGEGTTFFVRIPLLPTNGTPATSV